MFIVMLKNFYPNSLTPKPLKKNDNDKYNLIT